MKVLAHRGYHAHCRENTLESFQAALDLGVDGIETDIWLTTDDQLVIFHDRFAPGGSEVPAMTRAQLSKTAGFDVPTLADALALSSETLWNIELKSPAAAPALAVMLRSRPQQRFLLTSFYHPVIFQLSRELSVDCGLLIAHQPIDVRSLFPTVERAAASRLSTVVWDYTYLDQQLVETARAGGLQTFVYGLANPADHARAKTWGVNAIITDFPKDPLSNLGNVRDV